MAFETRYQPEEREAVAVAIIDRGIPTPRVLQIAAAGELELDGRRLSAFRVPESTARTWASNLRRRRRAERGRSDAASPLERGEALLLALGDELDEAITALREHRRKGKPPDEHYFKAHRAATLATKEYRSLSGDVPAGKGSKTVKLDDGRQVGTLMAAHVQRPGGAGPAPPPRPSLDMQEPIGPQAEGTPPGPPGRHAELRAAMGRHIRDVAERNGA